MAAGWGKVHIITGEFSLQFSLFKETQSLELIQHLSLDQIDYYKLLLVILFLGLTEIKVLQLILTEQVDDVLIIDLEVTDAHLGIQLLSEHPSEDLLDAEWDES